GHGGHLELETAEGRGTTFRVYFPAVPAVAEEPLAEDRPRHNGSGELVLLVDDEPNVRMVTKQILEGAGYRVISAVDGASAVKLFSERKHEVDVVLTDMMMPGMEGTAMIRALKEISPEIR